MGGDVTDDRKDIRVRISPQLRIRLNVAIGYLDLSLQSAVEQAIVEWLANHQSEIEAIEKRIKGD
jgi:hypothetical protein